MGSCVSIHRGSESVSKLSHSLECKTGNLVIIPSPIKNDRPIAGEHPINGISAKARKSSFPPLYGSKEEAFFDCQGWLDSDCEDDFLSVNGDFTPSSSCGSTPVHHNFSPTMNAVQKTHIENQKPSPTEKKKRLSELFKESLRDKEEDDDDDDRSESGTTVAKYVKMNLLPKFNYNTPRVSGANSVCSSDRTTNGDALYTKEKPIRSAQCCLPSLASCRGLGERRRKTTPKMSPAVAVAVTS